MKCNTSATLLFLLGILIPSPSLGAPPDPKALATAIDRLIVARWEREGIRPAPMADDAEFLRRVTLDIAGRIPTVAEVRAYLADPAPDKKVKVIERLLGSSGYVNHFTNVWKTVLIPEVATGDQQLSFFAPSFEAWLRRQILEDVPYDRFARALLTTDLTGERGNPIQVFREDGSMGVTPMAFFAAKEAKPENLAAATSRIFLGVKLECAQCHNHPFAKWTRQQFWEYAAFFAGIDRPGGNVFNPIRDNADRRELAISGTSQVVQATYLDGSEPRWRYKVSPRSTLADWVVDRNNPWFARAAANRLWGHFFGLGIVDPVDDLGDDNNQPSHPEILDALAQGFRDSGYDLKFLIRTITLSRAYSLSSAQTEEGQDEARLFSRMPLKALTGDQLFESLALATGFREVRLNTRGIVFPNGGFPRAEFAQKFAQQDRRTEAQTTILQALALMNGKFISDATSPARGDALGAIFHSPFLDTAGKVETLYLSTLSRRPRAEERERLVAYVNSGGPKKNPGDALGDILWALINSPEFLFNH